MNRPLPTTRDIEETRGGLGEKLSFHRPLIAVLVALVAAAIYIYSLPFLAPVKTARHKFSDIFFPLRIQYYRNIARDYLRPTYITLITIDEESYNKLGRRWPWSRAVFAEMLNNLADYEPKVIALDFALWGETEDNPEADVKLAEAMRRCGNVIVASVFGEGKVYLEPYKVLKSEVAGHGVVGAVKDHEFDSALRRLSLTPIVLAPQKDADVSFELKVAADYYGVSYEKMEQVGRNYVFRSEDKSKTLTIPTDEGGHILINYLMDSEDVETISAWQVLQDKFPKGFLKDKIAFVSRTGELFHDVHLTPLGYRPGGLILVNSINSIVTSAYLKEPNPKRVISVIATLYLLCFLAFYKTHPVKGFLILISVISSYSIAAFSLFVNNVLWPTFDVVVLLPLLFISMIVYKYGMVVLDSARLKEMSITDSLTNLYTHRYFRFLLEHTVGQSISYGQKCSLIVVRILNLEKIVKEISFNRGQRVQRKVAELIKFKLPKYGSGAYLGMGEFSMLLPRIGLYEALGIAGSLRDHVKEEDFGISEDDLKPAVAIGASEVVAGTFPKTGVELMRSARTAMARAKEIGYDKVCKFNPKIDSSVFEPDIIERQIRQRLDDAFTFLAIDLEERNRELEDLLRQLSITQRDLEQAHFETLHALVVAIEEKDPYTAGHSERVGLYAEKIGKEMKIPEEELRLLRQAGVLHDIGKVGMPQDILRKEDKLNPSERHIVELHPEFSVRILNTSKYFNRVLHAIRDHHERLDGSGYPRGLKGDQISIEAQIIAVCDVFDAMTTDRPYRKALSKVEALNELKSHPEKYHENIALAFERAIKRELSPIPAPTSIHLRLL